MHTYSDKCRDGKEHRSEYLCTENYTEHWLCTRCPDLELKYVECQ